MHGLSAPESANIFIQMVDLSNNKTGTSIHHLKRLEGIIPVLFILFESILFILSVFIKWFSNWISCTIFIALLQFIFNCLSGNGIDFK